jgi:hypothetical protein
MNYNMPINYQFNPYNNYLQQMQNQNQNNNIQTLFMRSKTVDDAKQYPLAPNTTAIFVTEDNNYCCLKSLGSSAFDTPVFIVYSRQQENTTNNILEQKQEIKQEEKQIEYATKQELNSYVEQFNIIGNNFGILKKENEKMRSEINKLKQELGIGEGAQNAAD